MKDDAKLKRLEHDFQTIMGLDVLTEWPGGGRSFDERRYRFRVDHKAIYSIAQNDIDKPNSVLIAQMLKRGPDEWNPFESLTSLDLFAQRALDAAQRIVKAKEARDNAS